jgi:cyclic pyranopterin monophosphate synthase
MEFTHLDKEGKPVMVDVGEKQATMRKAIAMAVVTFPHDIAQKLKQEELTTAKGSVIATAILAGIMGTKKTADLIPLCHTLSLDKSSVDMRWGSDLELIIECTAQTHGKTGVEMEALTGASVAALTVYDMCKAFSHDIEIKSIRLTHKSGGKRDFNHSVKG